MKVQEYNVLIAIFPKPMEALLSHLSPSPHIPALFVKNLYYLRLYYTQVYIFFSILGKALHCAIFLNALIQWYSMYRQRFSSLVFVSCGDMHHMEEDFC